MAVEEPGHDLQLSGREPVRADDVAAGDLAPQPGQRELGVHRGRAMAEQHDDRV
jgi:hypothetical protein